MRKTYACKRMDFEHLPTDLWRRMGDIPRNVVPECYVGNCRKHHHLRDQSDHRQLRRSDNSSHGCCNYILEKRRVIYGIGFVGFEWVVLLLQAFVCFPNAGFHGKSLKKSSHSSQFKPFVLCVHSHRPWTMSILLATPSNGRHRDAWP